MTPAKGNPSLLIRFEPEIIEAAQQAFPAVKGRSGGVSLAMRRLLYLALDQPMPRQFGEIGRAKDIDKLEGTVRELETLPSDKVFGDAEQLDLAAWAAHRARDLLKGAGLDPVDRLRLRAIVGRLALLKQPEH